MYPDGICKVSEKKYSKSIAFEDINYQLAQADDKTAIFENWCDFLNYFDASVSVQLSFINQGTQREQAEKAINIPAQDDAFNSIRTEYSDMLKKSAFQRQQRACQAQVHHIQYRSRQSGSGKGAACPY